MESEAENLKDKGNAQFKLTNYASAIRCYEAALQILKDTTNVKLKTTLNSNLSLCLYKQQRMQEALYYCEQALSIQPDFQKVIFRKAQILSQTGKVAESVSFLANYIQKTSKGRNYLENAAIISLYSQLRAKVEQLSASEDQEIVTQIITNLSQKKLLSSDLLEKYQSTLFRNQSYLQDYSQNIEAQLITLYLSSQDDKGNQSNLQAHRSFLLKAKSLKNFKNCKPQNVKLLHIVNFLKEKVNFLTLDKIEFVVDYLSQQIEELSLQEVIYLNRFALDGVTYSKSKSSLKTIDKVLLLMISYSEFIQQDKQSIALFIDQLVYTLQALQTQQDWSVNSNIVVFAKKHVLSFEESLVTFIKQQTNSSELQMLLLSLIKADTAVTLIKELNYFKEIRSKELNSLKLLNALALEPACAKLLAQVSSAANNQNEIIQQIKDEGSMLLEGTITMLNLIKISILVKLRVQTPYLLRDLPKLLTHLAHQNVHGNMVQLLTFLCLMAPQLFKQQSIAFLAKYIDGFMKSIETGNIYEILHFLCILTRGQTFKHYPSNKMRANPGVQGSSEQKEEFKEVVKSIQGGKDIEYGSQSCATIVRSSLLQNTSLSKLIHLITQTESFKSESSSKTYRTLLSELLLNLSFTQSCKRRIMQQGLISVLIELKEKNSEYGRIDAAEALARCFINTQMQGVSISQMHDSVRFLFETLIVKNSHELLLFEGCLALTNLSAYDSSVRQKLFRLNNASSFSAIFDLLFQKNEKVSRAGLELLANLSIQIDQENQEKYLKTSYLSSVLAHLHHSDQLVVFAALSFIANVVHLTPSKEALLHEKDGVYILCLLQILLNSKSETFLQRVVHILLNLDEGDNPLVVSKYVTDASARQKMKGMLLQKAEGEECLRSLIPWIQSQM